MTGRTTPKVVRRTCEVCGERRPESEMENHGKPAYPKWVCHDEFRCWGKGMRA